jgi:hypothetical protein
LKNNIPVTVCQGVNMRVIFLGKGSPPQVTSIDEIYILNVVIKNYEGMILATEIVICFR